MPSCTLAHALLGYFQFIMEKSGLDTTEILLSQGPHRSDYEVVINVIYMHVIIIEINILLYTDRKIRDILCLFILTGMHAYVEMGTSVPNST